MDYLRRLRLILVFLITSLFIPSLAYAQDFSRVFAPLFSILRYLFDTLGGEPIFQKFLVWMMLFSLLVILMKKMPFLKDEGDVKRSKIIAFVLSLMMTLAIPYDAIELLYTEYSLFAFIALFLLVPVLLFFATQNTNNFVRGLIFILVGAMFLIMTESIQQWGWAPAMSDFVSWIALIGALLLIVGLIMVVTGIGGLFGGGGGGEGPGTPFSFAKKVADKVSGADKAKESVKEDLPDVDEDGTEAQEGEPETDTVNAEAEQLGSEFASKVNTLEVAVHQVTEAAQSVLKHRFEYANKRATNPVPNALDPYKAALEESVSLMAEMDPMIKKYYDLLGTKKVKKESTRAFTAALDRYKVLVGTLNVVPRLVQIHYEKGHNEPVKLFTDNMDWWRPQ